MNYVGISCGFHDAALSVVDDCGNILFAGHSERYSKIKHDDSLCPKLIQDGLGYISGKYQLHYYEKPWLKAIRQFKAKQPIGPLSVHDIVGETNMHEFRDRCGTIHTHRHHLCHAAAGFQTSPFDNATVVVIDAIGELDTITIWNASYNDLGYANYHKIWSKSYPNSIGLLYSAMTARAGLKPLDEEYILMGMAAYGQPVYANEILSLLSDTKHLNFAQNLHIGVGDDFLPSADPMDIAASAQAAVEDLIHNVMSMALLRGKSRNLVFSGGVALNCLANRNLGNYLFRKIWIMPNPGDAGNSLGAAALGYGKKLKWTNAYLGHEIKGEYPVDNLIKELYTNKIVGVASGRAEFGPRALGNRSLLADPRGSEIKDKVNEIKRRQKFRPFAPVILEELLPDYFNMPYRWDSSRYMQVVATCRRPDLFPAIIHADGTSRVQSVPNDGSGIRKLLEQWYAKTGCPLLLNTSLNIRGEPMVNDRDDANRFEELYNVKVIS